MKTDMRATNHPGAVLRDDFLRPYWLSASALAEDLVLDAPRINGNVREKCSVLPARQLWL